MGTGSRVLDPFAGAGTALTTSARRGHKATGIELLPVAVAVAKARVVANQVDSARFEQALTGMRRISESSPNGYKFPHIRITDRAFPAETEHAFGVYLDFLRQIEDNDVRYLFWFAWIAVLEEVSFTRKDGQYLRWDSRSGRRLKSRFRKGQISEFWEAINRKLLMMLGDLHLRPSRGAWSDVRIIEGSSLLKLPKMEGESFELVITSPPYCNRYDYTRTYALELAAMGLGEKAVSDLRQSLLSATVENRAKDEQLFVEYGRLGLIDRYHSAKNAFNSQLALHEVLAHLETAKARGVLNNTNIPTMVRNYFFEMNLVIRELARLLSSGGRVIMVNDNVRYQGEEVPVDLILSDFAVQVGLDVEHIWVLPRGKGNSSQQMGAYGRTELRKCVYVWRKP
jgi:hypothetical protein